MARNAEERFWEKVDKDGPIPEHAPNLGPCWQWKAAKAGGGYGNFRAGLGHPNAQRSGNVPAHRYSYELLVGEIPKGLYVDHLCRNRGCVNPKHMEPVTPQINTLRGSSPSAQQAKWETCIRGHALDEENTYSWAKLPRSRLCRRCRAARVYALRHSVTVDEALARLSVA